MFLAPGQSRSVRPMFRDEYDNGFQKPCAAIELRITVDPPDLATVANDMIVWARAGGGTLRGEGTYADGTVRVAEGVVSITCGDVPPVPPPPPAPAITRAVLADPDVA